MYKTKIKTISKESFKTYEKLWFNIYVYKACICIYMKDKQNEYGEELGEGRQREIL